MLSAGTTYFLAQMGRKSFRYHAIHPISGYECSRLFACKSAGYQHRQVTETRCHSFVAKSDSIALQSPDCFRPSSNFQSIGRFLYDYTVVSQ